MTKSLSRSERHAEGKKARKAERIVIVGAGIAGLSAGVYARRAGFSVEILEKHTIPGGLCTSWRRGGYLFEGGMHWLTGSSEKLALNRVWKEVGALQENNPIFNKDPFYTLIDGDRQLHLYRDVDKIERHFIQFSPEDEKAVRRLCADIRCFLPVHMVVKDIPFLKTRHPARSVLPECLAMAPAGLRFSRLCNQSLDEYVSQFKSRDIRVLLLSVIGYRYNALSLVYTLASFASGDCGYPDGGSLRFARNIADTFERLGGTIRYRQTVEKVAVEDGRVTGVYAGGDFVPADAVIVSADAMQAVGKLFEPPLLEPWTKKLRRVVVTEQNMFVGIGVQADLRDLPRAIVFPLEKPFAAGGLEFSEIRVNNYALYPDHSPEGCTALTCLLIGDSYEFWKAAKENGTYRQEKDRLAHDFLERLEHFIPQIQGRVTVVDVATPMTYERYCDSFHGSWMSVWKPRARSFHFLTKTKIRGLYFAGQRTMMPGGLPVAVTTARSAVQYLCRDNHVVFV